MIFITIFLLLFLSVLIRVDKYKVEYVYLSFAIFLIFISSFRFESGLDYFNYKEIFNNFKDINISGEVLFWSLMKISKNIFDSYYFFVFITSFITVTIQCFFLYKLARHKIFSLFIFFATMYVSYDLGLQRNALALSLCIISLFYLLKGKKLAAIIFVALATLCHTTAILFIIPILFISLNRKKISNYYLILLLSSFFIGLILLNFKANLYLDELKPFVSDYILWKISFYTDSSNSYQVSGVNIYVIKLLVLSLVFFFFFRNDNNNFYARCYIIFSSIGLLLMFNVQMYTRLSSYSIIFEILLVPLVVDKVEARSKILIFIVLFITYGTSLIRMVDIFKLNEFRFF
ncbi:EpsG family protein [Photobacterium leiognathi]|uniref:EpsG family protein n=1 Tax=Photobacterium leiognathi TaxID=553611 RepID=UPI002981AF3D|nr:EpsG family protein [Photobacterium leiognathi]